MNELKEALMALLKVLAVFLVMAIITLAARIAEKWKEKPKDEKN